MLIKKMIPFALLIQMAIFAVPGLANPQTVQCPSRSETTTLPIPTVCYKCPAILHMQRDTEDENCQITNRPPGWRSADCDAYSSDASVKPTIFSEATNDMTIAREEIFGPVLTMIPYDSEDEAIRIANDTPYGLAGYVQSGDIDHARAVASKIRAGNIHINGASGGADIPFGGFKQSGNGREWGAHGFTDYLEIKAIEGYTAA